MEIKPLRKTRVISYEILGTLSCPGKKKQNTVKSLYYSILKTTFFIVEVVEFYYR